MDMTANYPTSQFVEIRFNVEKNERKALVRVIEEILSCKAVFLFAPTMAYTIGDYHLDRKGCFCQAKFQPHILNETSCASTSAPL